MITPERQRQFLSLLFEKCSLDKFWGDIQLKFKNGNLVYATTIQTLDIEAVLRGDQDLCTFVEERKQGS